MNINNDPSYLQQSEQKSVDSEDKSQQYRALIQELVTVLIMIQKGIEQTEKDSQELLQNKTIKCQQMIMQLQFKQEYEKQLEQVYSKLLDTNKYNFTYLNQLELEENIIQQTNRLNDANLEEKYNNHNNIYREYNDISQLYSNLIEKVEDIEQEYEYNYEQLSNKQQKCQKIQDLRQYFHHSYQELQHCYEELQQEQNYLEKEINNKNQEIQYVNNNIQQYIQSCQNININIINLNTYNLPKE